MVEAANNISEFISIPQGAQTVCELIEKNEDAQFSLEIAEKRQLSPDTIFLKFKFPNPDWIMGLPISKHMTFFKPAEAEGQQHVARKYTPVSPLNQKGSIDFVIKCYPVTEEFPNGGVMGAYLNSKQVGDTVLMEGPIGRLTYEGNATFKITGKEPMRKTKIGLIAGGSGITPLLSLMSAIHKAKDSTIECCKMIYSNKTEADILCKDELDAIDADESMPNLTVVHTLTRVQGDSSDPRILRGRVNIEMLRAQNFPEPSDETLIFSCGPAAQTKAIKEFLLAAGYSETMIFP